MKTEEVRDIVRNWLELQIKSTRGELITVKPKKFFTWLRKNPYKGMSCVVFWRLVKELAPHLGLKPIDSFSMNYRCKMVFLIESRNKQ